MDHDKLGRGIALRLLAVPDDERVVDVVVVAPPPPLGALEHLELGLARLVVPCSRQDKLRRVLRGGRRARLAELLGRAAVEDLEAGDEGALARRAVGAQARVLVVREERDRRDVVRGGPAGLLAVGGLVACARLELGDAVSGRLASDAVNMCFKRK